MDYSQIPLRTMQLPGAVGWWPLAPGWWVLALLVLCSVVALVVWWKRRKADPRRACLAELEKVKQRFYDSADDSELLVNCSTLLKRSALTLFPRKTVASLSGDRWIEFLLENSQGCDQAQFQCLVDGPYRPQSQVPAAELLAGCQQWLKTAGKGTRKDV